MPRDKEITCPPADQEVQMLRWSPLVNHYVSSMELSHDTRSHDRPQLRVRESRQ
jgi:hypothetical protein